MGQKDISEKILEAYNDVFADIVNVLLFDGQQVLIPEDLEDQAPRSAYKADGKYHEIERDTAKRWKKGNIRIACIGLENQTDVDPDMPLRVLAYDAAEYRRQLDPDVRQKYPVITLVLHFDYQKRWDKPLSLFEVLNIPDMFRPFVNDYTINLFDIAFLPREKADLFKSDFWFVADYFVQMQETGTYIPSTKNIKYVGQVLDLLAIMTKDQRFEETYNEVKTEGKELKNMCEFLDRVENKGRAIGFAEGKDQGISQGISQGEMKKAREVSINLHKNGVDDSIIAKSVNVSLEVLKQWLRPEKA